MTAADPPIWVVDEVREIDRVFDDDFTMVAISLHPSGGSHDASRRGGQFSGDCKARIDAAVSVTLLAPPPPPEPAPTPPVPAPPPTRPPTTPPCRFGHCQAP